MKSFLSLLSIFISLTFNAQNTDISTTKTASFPVKTRAFGSQFYKFYNIKILGIEYQFLYSTSPDTIEIITTSDPKFSINGKFYQDVPYTSFSASEQQGKFDGGYIVKLPENWNAYYYSKEKSTPMDKMKVLYFFKMK